MTVYALAGSKSAFGKPVPYYLIKVYFVPELNKCTRKVDGRINIERNLAKKLIAKLNSSLWCKCFNFGAI